MTAPTLCDYISSGVLEIDQRQKILLENVNILLAKIRKETVSSGIIKILSRLGDEIEKYFEVEEAYLQKILNRFEFADHQERHKFFVDFLRSPVLATTDDGRCDTQELTAFIIDWINFHIRQLDKTAFAASDWRNFDMQSLSNSVKQ